MGAASVRQRCATSVDGFGPSRSSLAGRPSRVALGSELWCKWLRYSGRFGPGLLGSVEIRERLPKHVVSRVRWRTERDVLLACAREQCGLAMEHGSIVRLSPAGG